MILFYFLQFISFPSRNDVVISSESFKRNEVNVESSGSIGLYYSGKCHQTYPNETLNTNEKMDWCSNIVPSGSKDMPWIMYSLKNKAIKATGFSLRNGCCWHACCCIDGTRIDSEYCCCRLYSFSLQGSNDNKTWVTIHQVVQDSKYWYCLFKTFTFEKTTPFNFLRIRMDEPYPGCPICMQINEIQIYGETVSSNFFSDGDYDENDESVSIIGKISRANNE